jgi:hypothetical protein
MRSNFKFTWASALDSIPGNYGGLPRGLRPSDGAGVVRSSFRCYGHTRGVGRQQEEFYGFTIEYCCDSESQQCWFLLTVTPLVDDRPNGAIVMHLDVTQQSGQRWR